MATHHHRHHNLEHTPPCSLPLSSSSSSSLSYPPRACQCKLFKHRHKSSTNHRPSSSSSSFHAAHSHRIMKSIPLMLLLFHFLFALHHHLHDCSVSATPISIVPNRDQPSSSSQSMEESSSHRQHRTALSWNDFDDGDDDDYNNYRLQGGQDEFEFLKVGSSSPQAAGGGGKNNASSSSSSAAVTSNHDASRTSSFQDQVPPLSSSSSASSMVSQNPVRMAPNLAQFNNIDEDLQFEDSVPVMLSNNERRLQGEPPLTGQGDDDGTGNDNNLNQATIKATRSLTTSSLSDPLQLQGHLLPSPSSPLATSMRTAAANQRNNLQQQPSQGSSGTNAANTAISRQSTPSALPLEPFRPVQQPSPSPSNDYIHSPDWWRHLGSMRNGNGGQDHLNARLPSSASIVVAPSSSSMENEFTLNNPHGRSLPSAEQQAPDHFIRPFQSGGGSPPSNGKAEQAGQTSGGVTRSLDYTPWSPIIDLKRIGNRQRAPPSLPQPLSPVPG